MSRGGWLFRVTLGVWWLLFGLQSPVAAASRAAATVEDLQAQIVEHLSQPRFDRALWGIQAVSLDTGATLFATNAQRLLKPASNNKLFTGALALDLFGPDFRIRTDFYAGKPPTRRGTLRGDLVVFGRGDPSFAARFHGGDYTQSLQPLVAALRQAGVRRVTGDLVGDERFFRGPPYGSSWTWDDLQYYYGAEVSALSAEDNTLDLEFKPGPSPGLPCTIVVRPATDHVHFDNRTVTVTNGGPRRIDLYRAPGSDLVRVTGQLPVGDRGWTDAVAVSDPAGLFLRLLHAELRRHGIKVSGRLRTVDWRERHRHPADADGWVKVAEVLSPPMSELVARMMKPSQNLYAQLLFLQAGERQRGAAPNPEGASEDLGLIALRGFLAKAGIPADEVLIEEGSGLSRGALVTPRAVVSLLRHMDDHPQSVPFRESLPVAGLDGTLRQRMKDTVAAGLLRAKTGTLRYVNTLSGYTTTRAGERLAFSILLNAYRPPPGSSGRDEIDAVAVMLTSCEGRSSLR